MFNTLSWKELIRAVVPVLAVYYLLVILVYCRKDITGLIKPPANLTGPKPATDPDTAGTISSQQELFSTVHELLEELKDVFSAAVDQQLDKAQILEAIRVRLDKYPAVKGTDFQDAVTGHIEQELVYRCDLQLTSAERNILWT